MDFRDTGSKDSAFTYFNKAKDVLLLQNDSLKAGKALVNMGIIATDKGDFYGGIELSLSAIQYFEPKNKSHFAYISANYNNLGIASYELADYDHSIKFYDQAIRFADNQQNRLSYLNNKAKSYEEAKNFEKAITIYQQVLDSLDKNSLYYARTLTNLTYTRWQANPQFNPAPDLLNALEVRQRENDFLGMNYSYARLADYYSKTGRKDLGTKYAQKMYNIAQQVQSADDRLEALYKLILLSPGTKAKEYFYIYEKLDDSLQTARSTAKNQFALVRYETEKHKANFLHAKAEGAIKENTILKKNISLSVLMLLLVIGYLFYRKRKKRLEQEKALEVKNTEIKYVKKVHDRVANKVYHIISELENTRKIEKEQVLDRLDTIYRISRDISYEDSSRGFGNFTTDVSAMLEAYASESIQVIVIENEDAIWNQVSPTVEAEILCVLQELMTNMKKHSEANRVIIRFERKNNTIYISYSDNGKGINELNPKNGLKNTETRIKSISGNIIFETGNVSGLKIQISFPVT